MTSPSRKNRRTTPWATTVRATAFSLLAAAGPAAAQVPGPAPTTWGQLPVPQVEHRPVPTVVPLTPPNLHPVVVPPGTVQYTKPPGEARPTVPVLPAVRAFPGGAVSGTPVSQEKPQVPGPQATPQPTPAGEKSKAVEQKGDNLPAPALPVKPGVLPTREDVFRLDGDAALDSRILKDLKKEKTEVFPMKAELVPAGTVYTPKTAMYPPRQAVLEPNYVVHRRLYFEEMNSDRHGWDHGVLQPAISTLYFYKDVLTWPHKLASGLFHPKYDTSAGKCMPGSPTAYYFYPPGLTTTGSLFEAGVITGVAIILP